MCSSNKREAAPPGGRPRILRRAIASYFQIPNLDQARLPASLLEKKNRCQASFEIIMQDFHIKIAEISSGARELVK